jgi:hypothetical protein
VLSVGVPILLLGLALPETRGRSLLSRRETTVAAGTYVLDIVLLVLISNYWRVQLAWIVGVAVVAILLWVVAVRLPPGWLDPPRERPTHGPRAFFLLGLVYFPVLLIVPGVGEDLHLPAPLAGGIDLLLAALLFFAVQRSIGRRANEPQMVLLALGITLPILLFGLFSQVGLPVVLAVDLVYGLFFHALWRHCRPEAASPTPLVVAVR